MRPLPISPSVRRNAREEPFFFFILPPLNERVVVAVQPLALEQPGLHHVSLKVIAAIGKVITVEDGIVCSTYGFIRGGTPSWCIFFLTSQNLYEIECVSEKIVLERIWEVFRVESGLALFKLRDQVLSFLTKKTTMSHRTLFSRQTQSTEDTVVDTNSIESDTTIFTLSP